MIPCKLLFKFGVLATVGGWAGHAHALTVLVIDVSNPAAVTFTATTNVSQVNSSLNIGTDGITIQNFFLAAVNVPSSTTVSGNLKPPSSSFVYGGLGSFNYEANNGLFTAANDLSVFSNGGAPLAGSQTFSTASQAFSGSFTVNFSSYAGSLPTAGTTGQVITGYFQSGTPGHGQSIGQFSVIPEPSIALTGGLGLLAFAGRRRR